MDNDVRRDDDPSGDFEDDHGNVKLENAEDPADAGLDLASEPSSLPATVLTLEQCLARTSRWFHRRTRRLRHRFLLSRRHLPHLLPHWVLGLPRFRRVRLSTLAQKVSLSF